MPPKTFSFAPSRGMPLTRLVYMDAQEILKVILFLQTQRFDLRTSPRLFHILLRLLPIMGNEQD